MGGIVPINLAILAQGPDHFESFSFPSATHPENEGGVRDGEGPSKSQPEGKVSN